MKCKVGGAGGSPSPATKAFDGWFCTPTKDGGRVAVKTGFSPARGGSRDKQADSEDDLELGEEDRGKGTGGRANVGGRAITGGRGTTGSQGTTDDDAGSTPRKRKTRTKSQLASAEARNQAEYNIQLFGLKRANFFVYKDFFVYDQDKCKGVKQVQDIAVCKLCYDNKDALDQPAPFLHMCEIASGKTSSTNRRRHLEQHHEKEFMEQIKEIALSKVADGDGEQLISSFFSHGPLASDRQASQALFDEAMCEYYVKKLVPLRHADDPAFNKMVEAAGKAAGGTTKVNVMHRDTLRTRLLEILQLVREKLSNLVEGQYISMGFDCWTSEGGETLIAAKMHWIPETWEKVMSSIVSVDKVEGRMCAEDIVRILNCFVKEHLASVGGIIGVGSDCEPSLVCASREDHDFDYEYFS